ncbi:MAG: thiamine-phosphate kinase [Nanoarchaeota archaeon]|nr:thiamine-phosphate kinase [Nanoarchaeota archaeon]MBU1705034.1 thiamine-phosphate kinase [Nanoarchaeota archaeon]
MKIKDIGGEFALINRLKNQNKGLIKGIGDDCAIVNINGKKFVVTTDTLVEGDHFSFNWFTPEQVGMKAIEINVSDIGAMGGKPLFCLISLVLPKDIEVEVIDNIYKGMQKSAAKYNLNVIGGNMTHGQQLVIDVDMFGTVEEGDLCQRKDAKPGDFIFVTGDLGASTAGLKLYQAGKKPVGYVKRKHIEPKAQFHKVKPFLKYINAMIDVSDGLASDVTRICEQADCGAIIYADNVPIRDETRLAAKRLCNNPVDYALFGGEDFELIFTVSEKNLKNVKGYLVGEITKKKGVRIFKSGKETPLKTHGYDHFLSKS